MISYWNECFCKGNGILYNVFCNWWIKLLMPNWMNAHLFSSFMFLSHSIKKLDFFHWFYGRWFGRSLLIYCRIFLLIFPSSFLDGFINLHVGFRNYLYGPSGWQMLQLLQIALLISKSLQFALLQGWWNLLILAVRFYIIS